MNDSKQIPHPRGDPNNDDTGGHGRRPYWKRAHRDWRIWFCTIMMLAAMLAYVATGAADVRSIRQLKVDRLVELGLPEGEGKVSSPTLLRFASLVANTTHRIAG
jgi:hypothetical protein